MIAIPMSTGMMIVRSDSIRSKYGMVNVWEDQLRPYINIFSGIIPKARAVDMAVIQTLPNEK